MNASGGNKFSAKGGAEDPYARRPDNWDNTVPPQDKQTYTMKNTSAALIENVAGDTASYMASEKPCDQLGECIVYQYQTLAPGRDCPNLSAQPQYSMYDNCEVITPKSHYENTADLATYTECAPGSGSKCDEVTKNIGSIDLCCDRTKSVNEEEGMCPSKTCGTVYYKRADEIDLDNTRDNDTRAIRADSDQRTIGSPIGSQNVMDDAVYHAQ